MHSEHDGQGAATARLLDLIGAGWTTQAVGVAAELGIADVLAAGPLDAATLAERLHADYDAIERLLRALVSLEVCSVKDDGRYALTPMGALLQSDGSGSLHAWAIWWSRYLWPLWGDLKETIVTGQSARLRATGTGGFSHVQSDPAAARVFNAAMAELTALVAEGLLREVQFPASGVVADVGGGFGELLVGVLRAHPSLRGLLFELPHALEGARQRLAAAGMAHRVQVQGGDFFESVPGGAAIYLIKSVLHNWDDAHAIRLLARCRAAMGPDARLLVVERVLPHRTGASDADRAIARNDLNMLIGLGGRERTQAQLDAVCLAAGLRLMRRVSLALGLQVLELIALEP